MLGIPSDETLVLFLKKLFLLICGVCLLSGCGTLSFVADTKLPANSFGLHLHQRSLVIDRSKPPIGKSSGNPYLDYYSLIDDEQREQVQYSTGVTEIGPSKVRSHVFFPKNPVGTIFILHGYFDHVGSLNNIVNAALEKEYAVFAYDLPGHGMSSGNRGEISGIENNAVLLNNIVDKYSALLPEPYQLIGFSTGGTIALEHARATRNSPFEKTVLVSPLLRHTQWHWGKVAYTLFRPFVNRVRSRDKTNSSDTEYLAFARQDPLRNSHVSFQFLKDIYHWNRKFYHSSDFRSDMLVVQGEADTVVDWRYNLPLLQRKVNGLEVQKVIQGRHQLFNQVKTEREEVFEKIFNFFEDVEK